MSYKSFILPTWIEHAKWVKVIEDWKEYHKVIVKIFNPQIEMLVEMPRRQLEISVPHSSEDSKARSDWGSSEPVTHFSILLISSPRWKMHRKGSDVPPKLKQSPTLGHEAPTELVYTRE
ncbi:hypothetical protein C8J56DRAFT_898954 [Mycena floridula]|nr:hypothetical protein C8J56DRAFT_898954 [Mycena floridula]